MALSTVRTMHIPLEAYFPDCVLPDCAGAKHGAHQHILPHQQSIIDCDTKYLYCQGGVGSAKSLAFAVKCCKLSLEIPQNKGVVSRLHYDDLFDSSWGEIQACLQRLVDREYIRNFKAAKKVQGEYTEYTLPNGSELKAIQGKNWSRGLGASHGWFWVDDAMEAQEEFFIGTNTSAGLLSRLRLSHVLFDRRVYDAAKRPYGALHGMVSSNPPPYGHWLHKLFGDKPGVHAIGDDAVTWMMTATTDNPFAGVNYAKGLIAVQQRMGHTEQTTRRVIFGESIPAYKGLPVFPQFDRAAHVAPLRFRPDLPLIRAWDFGFLHPAVTFSNIFKCKHGTNHYFTLSEVADAFNVTIYQFYDKYVKPHTEALYNSASLMRDAGDRTGFRSNSSNKDGRSDMKILIGEYKIPFSYRYTSLEPSLQYMRGLLQPKTPCRCGLPLILISNKCPILLGALEGGYHLPKTRSGTTGEKPVEDRLFADVACAWRYGAENFVKWGVQRHRVTPEPVVTTETYDDHHMQRWLDGVDAVLASTLEKIHY